MNVNEKEILKRHPKFNLGRVDALIARLDRLGIVPDRYNLRSRYEEPNKRDKAPCDQEPSPGKLSR